MNRSMIVIDARVYDTTTPGHVDTTG